MRARDIIVIARRRAGLTQQELGGRLGTSQVTVARWESGATEPKFQTVQEVVAACQLDLTLGLATGDEDSWTALIHEQLGREPVERVSHLSRDRFDRVAALELVGAVGPRAIVVGEVAGALHGWPLILSDEGTLDLVVHPEDRGFAAETILAASAVPDRVRFLDAPPGTYGFADLARAATEVTVGEGTVEVAGLVDLLRIALTDPAPYSQRFALALDATLQFAARGARLTESTTPSLHPQPSPHVIGEPAFQSESNVAPQ
ncbi:MAG TPA: helix-turn-helix transcriptional regulator [Solirubrobacteraceae bacterium]|jgi:transcriptional regulator with XRE-family HTH domain